MISAFQFQLLGISESWVPRWLTTIWLLGVGLAVGLIGLACLIGIFSILSKIPIFEKLRKSGMAHVASLIGTIVLGSALTLWAKGFYISAIDVNNRSDEWLLVSIALFIISAMVSWSFFFCSSQRLMGELKTILVEGIGGYLLAAVGTATVLGLLCTLAAESPMEILSSLPQLASTGESVQTATIKGSGSDAEDAPFLPAAISFDPNLLQRVQIKTDRNIVIGDADSLSNFAMKPVRVERDEERIWTRKGTELPPVPVAPGSQIYIQNQEVEDATVQFIFTTIPAHPEVRQIIIAALCVMGFGLLFLLQQAVSPTASAIAMATAKSEVSQPLFAILCILAAFLILLCVVTPFFTLGEDIKLLKDCGLTIILAVATFQGVWSASGSVNDELEGRTALTVLSKPVSRRAFLIGKMLGVFWLLSLMFFILGWWELLWVAYKPIYDSKESSQELPIWQACNLEVMRTIPGLAMHLFQAISLCFFSVAISTRLPQMANFSVCTIIYALGHLTEAMVSTSSEGFAPIQFFGTLIAIIIPDLEHFSLQQAIDNQNPVPIAFLAGVLVYALLYVAFSILVGLLLFEDRDLA